MTNKVLKWKFCISCGYEAKGITEMDATKDLERHCVEEHGLAIGARKKRTKPELGVTMFDLSQYDRTKH